MSRNLSRGTNGPYDVLLIESEPDRAAPFIDSFEATDATETVHVVTDGGEALDYVHRRGHHADAPRPDLVVLDLHVFGTDGEQILEEIAEQPELRLTPVLVFTTSETAEDVARSYRLNANAYLRRPDDAEGFVALARAIEDFWLELTHLPPK